MDPAGTDGGDAQTDRGPRTTDPDGPRSARGLWRLTRLAGVDDVRARRLAEAFPRWADLHNATTAELRRLGAAGMARQLQPVPEGELPRTVDAEVVAIFDPRYPTWLAQIPNPPLLLWVEGQLPGTRGVAVLGTRTPGPYGLGVAARAATEVVAAGLPVVSGMAAGIDQAAERSAMDAGGIVVSVLGCGLDQVPPSVAAHRDRIIATSGAVLSEQPPGTKATQPTLTARNRIQTGLSAGVVVCQATLRSSTADTVRFALVQGCRLLVPRPPDGSVHATHPESALLLALTDPNGCDPALLGLSGRHASMVANRRPAADEVIIDGEALALAIGELAGREAA